MSDQNRFKNRRQAFAWLSEQKAPVSQRAFYDACASGSPQIAADKSLSRFDVSEYLRRLEGRHRPIVTADESARREAETRKAIADARKAELQAEVLEREHSKRWMQREDAEEIACLWTSLLRDGLAWRLRQALPTICHAAGGHPDRAAEVAEIIEQTIRDACNDIATAGEVTVEFVGDDED